MLTRRSRGLLIPGLAAAVALAVIGGVGLAAALEGPNSPADAAGAPAVLPAGQTYTVTLLTGDVVTVRTTPSGCPTVTVRPVDPSGVMRRSCGPDGHVRVIPGKVASFVGSTLDPALFDVTTLILDGYDDARTSELPLIVRPTAPGARPLTADPLVTGLAGARGLPSIAAVSGRRPKANGGDFLRTLPARPGVRSTGASARVWLDRRVRANDTVTRAPAGSLDPNLRQIDAPRAWAAGYTGQGSRVAVLDTGADFTHPDLVGRVAERADFTVDNGDAVDRDGHGTHVAATIAGSGAASGGQRRGVAPDAQLLIGKVLNDEGAGAESQIIAGMEWAAARSDVINMSLGTVTPSDGTDPMSLAVDALTEQTGTLFVIAAGNTGPTDGSVGAPGAAASALTVGAVDGNDVPAVFSSRGPLLNTRIGKPELTAPGVDIVAARAAGTTMGRALDARYTIASGTSMASPHVAGAAAVLVQRHPDWRAEQLRAALVGAADPLAGVDVYAAGAGRLDVARALAGAVAGQATVNLGTFAYPQAGTAEAALSWTNTDVTPVELDLAVTVTDHHGVPAPSGTASLAGGPVRLAPGATGGATLLVNRALLGSRPGLYTAMVTARTGGTFASGTPVTFYVEPPSHDLTVNTTALPDTPPGSVGGVLITVVNLDDPAVFSRLELTGPASTVTVRVPAGRYSVMGSFLARHPETEEQSAALVGDPDVEIAADVTLTLDASRAERLTATVEDVDTEAGSVAINYFQTARRGPGWYDFLFAFGQSAKDRKVYVAPTPGVGIGTFQVYTAFRLHTPGTAPSPYLYDLIHPLGNGIPDEPGYRVTAAERATLARIDQRFHRLDGTASTAHKRYGFSPEGVPLAGNSTDNVPAERVDYVSPGFAWLDEASHADGLVTTEAQRRYPPGSRQIKTWVRQPLRSDWYDDPAGSPGMCGEPGAPARSRGNLHVELVTLTDAHQRFFCRQDGDSAPDITRRITLHRDGSLVGEVGDSIGDFAVPQRSSDYRLTYDVDASGVLDVSTRISTAWTFRSTGPRGTGSTPLPLLSVDYALPLDLANHPVEGAAEFTVHQAHGVRAQRITSFRLWTSTDDGTSWTSVPVERRDDGAWLAQLPQPAPDRAVSLRVEARGDGGSGVEQTIIRAYR